MGVERVVGAHTHWFDNATDAKGDVRKGPPSKFLAGFCRLLGVRNRAFYKPLIEE